MTPAMLKMLEHCEKAGDARGLTGGLDVEAAEALVEARLLTGNEQNGYRITLLGREAWRWGGIT
jgi:hypothetical protein